MFGGTEQDGEERNDTLFPTVTLLTGGVDTNLLPGNGLQTAEHLCWGGVSCDVVSEYVWRRGNARGRCSLPPSLPFPSSSSYLAGRREGESHAQEHEGENMHG